MTLHVTRPRLAIAGLALAIGLATTACPGSIHHNYRTFQSAVDRGASCAELFDQRSRFTGAEDLARIDTDLGRIGCISRDFIRNPR